MFRLYSPSSKKAYFLAAIVAFNTAIFIRSKLIKRRLQLHMLCGGVGGISDHAFAAHPVASPVSYPVAQLPPHQSCDIQYKAPDSPGLLRL
jgi:hypothetical protein